MPNILTTRQVPRRGAPLHRRLGFMFHRDIADRSPGPRYADTHVFGFDNSDRAFLENISPGNKVTPVPLVFDVPSGTSSPRTAREPVTSVDGRR
jgi:hypothetical protein